MHAAHHPTGPSGVPNNSHPTSAPSSSPHPASMQAFEAGQIFAHFDQDRDGRLDKKEFEHLVAQIPSLFRSPSSSSPAMSEMTAKLSATIAPPSHAAPVEVVSGRVLTHYDETAGIPLPQASVDQHKSMGNLVTPLVDAYKARYDRLRSLLSGKLLPKRGPSFNFLQCAI